MKAIAERLRALRAQLTSIKADWSALRDISRPVQPVAGPIEAEIESLLAERYRLRIDRDYWRDATLELKLDDAHRAADATPPDVGELNRTLRGLLNKVIVEYNANQLVLDWKHGGSNRVYVNLKRLRGTPRHEVPHAVRARSTDLQA